MSNSTRLPQNASDHNQWRISESLEIDEGGDLHRGYSRGNGSECSTTAISPQQNVILRIPRSHSTTRSIGSTHFPGRSLTAATSSSLPSHSHTWIDEWRVAAFESKAESREENKQWSKTESTGENKTESNTENKSRSKAEGKSRSTAGSSVKPKHRIAVDPPRSAREGCEWVWYAEGYWAEREISAVIQSSEPSSKSNGKFNWRKMSPGRGDAGSTIAMKTTGYFLAQDEPPPKNPKANRSLSKHHPLQSSPKDSESSASVSGSSDHSSRFIRGLQQMSPTYPHFISPSGEPEGLYCKTKRGIGVGLLERRKKAFDQDSIFNPLQIPSQTTVTLEGAATYFQQLEQESGFSDRNSNQTPSIISKFSRKRIGLAPWHRSNSQDDSWSVTSSIRDLVRGKTPLSTPNSEVRYSGPDGQDFVKVEISNPADPAFLPSEARRVNTPPTNKASAAGKARGLFFDLTPLSNELASETTTWHKGAASSAGVSTDAQSPHLREWWDDEIPIMAQRKEERTKEFALDVPEHLPSSPLCPTHPKHKSGGMGVCVYHGRRKNSQATLQHT